ncbi:MAG TPA: TIGR03842 family LLM class F420-dependent oxidoreductase [Candidatus Limnocylindrales bacterium]|jgi:probable F420-dependent oxidoreductase|nr:TIGR03842 family LLM class F420-dependent oxidoreductase [Candidatus Limnocylindrales bacterium]
MEFGFTLKPDHRYDRSVDLARRAEANGFGHGWLFDSHILWRDPYPLLTLIAGATDEMRLGTCVTNPATRDVTVTASSLATLNEISGGRMDLGIGRGDSARRVMGKKPTTVAYMEECCRVIRSLTAGEAVTLDGTEIQMPWASQGPVPIWIAGYGPMALAAAGRVADGIILQLADPDIIRWCTGFVRAAAVEAGRDPDAIQVMAAAAAYISDDVAGCRERVRWFPALVSNHVVDLINKYPKDDLPEALWRYVQDREGYDYLHHAEVGSDNARFVSDEIVDRFAIVGDAEAHRARLDELRDAGVTQFNVYLMNGDEEEQLDLYRALTQA